jgi:hypothetical protein
MTVSDGGGGLEAISEKEYMGMVSFFFFFFFFYGVMVRSRKFG